MQLCSSFETTIASISKIAGKLGTLLTRVLNRVRSVEILDLNFTIAILYKRGYVISFN